MTSNRLTFITPLFSKGSYDDLPEIRPPSIRGQLHWWFRALGGNANDEKAIFGGVHGGATASKVVVRVNNISGDTGEVNTLPHKHGGQASPKWAYRSGSQCDLHVSTRLGGLEPRLAKEFERVLHSWLHLGTLGLRGTRAAGSFVWEALNAGEPTALVTVDEYRTRCKELLQKAPLKFHLIDRAFSYAEDARRIVSDTIGGRDDRQGEDSLSRINHPLGKIFQGRKTSPLRFRIVKIGSDFHIAALWDDRTSVTGNRPSDLTAVIKLLSDKDKEIGHLLQNAFTD